MTSMYPPKKDGTPREQTSEIPQLPDLEPGITLLEVEQEVDSVIHALAVDHVLLDGGGACWIDPGTHAQTGPLVEVAPSARILQRVHVARGFTAFQHLALLDTLPDMLTDRTSLVVVPDIDRYYRDDNLLGDEGQEMLLTGIASLASVASTNDLSVLLTRTRADAFSEPVETAATNTLACEATPFGPRFRTGGEQTLAYPVDGGRWMQTTLAFWERILAAREPLYEDSQSSTAPPQHSQEVTVRGTN